MMNKLEGRYHWVSIGCMAVATSMLCVGNTALEAALQESGVVVAMIFWSVCAAFTVATAGFAYLALLSAQKHLQELEARTIILPVQPASPVQIASGARFSTVKKQHAEY